MEVMTPTASNAFSTPSRVGQEGYLPSSSPLQALLRLLRTRSRRHLARRP
jgi:hypothetical protein